MKGNGKNLVYSIIPGVIIGFMFVTGYYAKNAGGITFSARACLAFLLAFCVASTCVYWIHFLIDKLNRRIGTDEKIPWINRKIESPIKYFFLMWIVLMICWLPSFLALMPGLFVYDAPWQYYMVRDAIVTEHHPVLHTYMVGLIIENVYKLTGSFNWGVAAYEAVQMLIIGAGAGYIFYAFHKRKEPMWLHVVTLVFFAFFPTCVIFVFAITKEGIFSIAVADFCLINLSLIEDKKGFFEKRSNIVLWIVFAVIVCIFRNNAVYALLFTLPFFIVMLVKSECNLRKAFLMIGITVLVMIIYKYPVTRAITVGGVNEQEMLSMPAQQFARTYLYRYDELTDEERKTIEDVFKDEGWKNYVPGSADYTKASIDADKIKSDIGRYGLFWLKLGFKFPQEFLNSVYENIYSLWYLFPKYVSYSDGGTTYSPMTSIVPAVQNSKFPWLYEFFKQFDNGSIVMGNNFIAWIFSPALFLYFSMIAACYTINKKGKNYALPFAFCALYWLTFVLGPFGLVRYVLFYFYTMPVWLAYMRKGTVR